MSIFYIVYFIYVLIFFVLIKLVIHDINLARFLEWNWMSFFDTFCS